MGEIANFTNALFGAVNTAVKVDNNILSKEAKLSTQNKQIQLQEDIRNKLMDLRQRADYTNWNQEMTGFFEQIKSGMSDPNSKYYCKNNMQGDMFNSILEQNRLGVTEKVGQMVQQREMEKDIVDVQNSKTLLAQTYSGQQYIDMANELDRGLYETGRISLQQYDQQKDLNFKHGYETMYLNTFDASLDQALAAGKSFDQYFTDIENSMPAMKATDTSGLEKAYDTTTLKTAIKKTCQQNYYAKLQDIQQGNANRLSEIVQEMRQKETEEGKLSVARRGQREMNNMLGLKLSKQDRDTYSRYFEATINSITKSGGSGSGSGSGSGKPSDSVKDFIANAPETAFQWMLDGKLDNLYGSVQVMSEVFKNKWLYGDYKENYGKDYDQRKEDYELIYRGVTSEDAITTQLKDKLKERFPSASMYIDKDLTKLIKDMGNNPEKYGDATAQDLASWSIDRLMGADASYTDKQFAEDLQEHINNCYIEKCKYVEFNKKGELQQKFNATDPAQIAQAARVASKDYVYNFGETEYWAKNKKEALEAEGGVVNVLENAVRSTLDIPENIDQLPYQWQLDEYHNDITSTPIFTYNNMNYQVVPNEDDSGFRLAVINPGTETREINGKIYEVVTDENGKTQLQEVKYITGKAKDYKGERAAEKKEKKNAQNAAHDARTALEEQRAAELDNKMKSTTEQPKAITGVYGKDSKDWKKTQDTIDARQTLFRDALIDIDKAFKKVTDGKMKGQDFYDKFGIRYLDWYNAQSDYDKYNLILDSK